MSFIPALKNYPSVTIPINSVIKGGVMAGIGFVVSKITNVSPLLALVFGVEAAVLTLITGIITAVGQKKGLELYKIALINVAVNIVISTAAIVAIVALGIFTSPLYIGLAAGLISLGTLYQLAQVAYFYYLQNKPNVANQPQQA